MKHGEESPRVWATRDRAIAPPQRTLARTMRAKPTDAERKLWWHLRHRLRADSHFRRQVQIGRYIADFVCHASRIVIEVDGGQHGQRMSADAARTRFFESEGYRVFRFWNNDVFSNTDGVLEAISFALTSSTPTPNPSPPSGHSRPSSTGYGGGEKHRRECP